MTRDETLALWARCEDARAKAKAAGADYDKAHEAAKAVWDAWAKPLLARRAEMEKAGTWKTRRAMYGSIEPSNSETTAYFTEALVDFSGNTFQDVANFSGFNFPGEARFSVIRSNTPEPDKPAKFEETVWFEKATFSGDTIFEKAIFSGPAVFRNAAFSGIVTFEGAIFTEVAIFVAMKCQGGASFERSIMGET